MPLVEGKDGGTSKAAAEGTFAHNMFERRLKGGALTPRLGIEKEVGDWEFEYDLAMMGHLDTAQQWVEDLGPGLLFPEAKVALTITYGGAGEFQRVIKGTADVTLQPDSEPGVLHIIDLKYGQGIRVYAEHNTQLMLYAAAAMEHFASLIEDIHTVVLHILQPRLEWHDEFRMSVPDLMDWVQGPVSSAVGSVLLGQGLVFAPSKKACQWCPIAPCKAAMEKAGEAFEDLTTPGVAPTDGEVLGEFLSKVPFYSMIAKAAHDRAVDMLTSGEHVPGYKMVTGKGGSRKWSTPEQAILTLLADGHNPYTEPELVSVAVAEKFYGKKAFAESEAADLVIKPKGNPTLTTADDKRAALTFTPSTFDNLGDDNE